MISILAMILILIKSANQGPSSSWEERRRTKNDFLQAGMLGGLHCQDRNIRITHMYFWTFASAKFKFLDHESGHDSTKMICGLR